MLNVFTQVIILFSLMAIGFICKKTKLISNDMNQDVSSLLVNVSVPALIIVSLNSFTFSQKLLTDSMRMLVISFALYFFFVLISYLSVKLLQVQGTTRDIYQFGLVFGNTGLIGFPVANAVFGAQGLLFMAVCDVVAPLFMWTFGVIILCRPRKAEREPNDSFPWLLMLKDIINPNIAAVCIGFLLLGTTIELPLLLNEILQLLGSLTAPLAMIFIGSILGDMHIKTFFQDKRTILCSLTKLMILPLMVLVILKMLGFDGYLLSIPVLYTAMPVGVLTSILAAKHDNDYQLASRLILVSTLLSIFTIPGIILILNC